MIDRLTGTIVQKTAPAVVIDVQGVGYCAETPMSTFCSLPPLGDVTTLLTHMVVREDAHLLYGFSDEQERQTFRALLKVSGIGPRVALSVLSTLTPQQLVQSIEQQQLQLLTKVPGVGRKTAERLVLELKDRIDTLFIDSTVDARSAVDMEAFTNQSEVENALLALGYKSADVRKMISGLDWANETVESAIKRALRQVVPV